MICHESQKLYIIYYYYFFLNDLTYFYLTRLIIDGFVWFLIRYFIVYNVI